MEVHLVDGQINSHSKRTLKSPSTKTCCAWISVSLYRTMYVQRMTVEDCFHIHLLNGDKFLCTRLKSQFNAYVYEWDFVTSQLNIVLEASRGLAFHLHSWMSLKIDFSVVVGDIVSSSWTL